MGTNVEADIDVQKFGFVGDATGNRLVFPRAHTHQVAGRSGGTAYGATDCAFEGLEGRLDTLRWSADAASIGSAWLRDDAGRFDVAIDRVELPHGIMLVRADKGIELLSPHVSLSEVKLTIKGPFARAKREPGAPPKPLRQERWRFLDSLAGKINLRMNVQLDLPVLGVRTLDQELKVPIKDGSLDYRALEDSLNWLEGRFLDLEHEEKLLKLQWKVPIFGSTHDLISWPLDAEADTLAAFGRVPVRSLADFRFPKSDDKKPDDTKGRKVLKAFALEAIDIALSLLAPRNVEVGAGMIMFGGDDQPGLVDLKVSGAIRDRGVGGVSGAIGSIDTTIKDLRLGPVMLTADRLHFDGLDHLEVAFDGFSPTSVTVVVHRVTATNLAIKIGS